MSNPGRKELLALYKQILRGCQTYPSARRPQVYQAIREEFRDNATLTDAAKIAEEVIRAQHGLKQLRQFDEVSLTGGKPGSNHWSVTLEQNPMPKPPPDYETRKAQSEHERTKRLETVDRSSNL